jgi:GNAT superfamily N-acetyltransferase
MTLFSVRRFLVKPARTALRNAESYEIDDDVARLDFGFVHAFLTASYWSPGISRDQVERAARASWSFGLFAPTGAQAGFARLITDYETFGYLADVFVIEAHRGRGLAKWLVGEILAATPARRLRRILLATRDAHGLYAQFGFAAPAALKSIMEINRPDIYSSVGRGV